MKHGFQCAIYPYQAAEIPLGRPRLEKNARIEWPTSDFSEVTKG